MGDQAPRNNLHCTIPDDPEQSTYRFISASMKSLRSPSVSSLPMSGFPDASLGAAWLYATGIHLPMARMERPVRIAGSPDTIPLNTVGYRCDRIMPSRPPVEQPTKYEYAAGLA